jgi:hypothetical protein
MTDIELVDDFSHGLVVGDVGLHQGPIADGGPVTEFHAVEHDDVPSPIAHQTDRMGADVTCAARHQDRHPHSLAEEGAWTGARPVVGSLPLCSNLEICPSPFTTAGVPSDG